MSRKYPRPVPHYRPVSQNAYDTFVRRIYAVMPKDNRCADMIDALDKYLDGDRDTYASHLDEYTAITFEMLRFEIDKAIERSARARRPRRKLTSHAEQHVASMTEQTNINVEIVDITDSPVKPAMTGASLPVDKSTAKSESINKKSCKKESRKSSHAVNPKEIIQKSESTQKELTQKSEPTKKFGTEPAIIITQNNTLPFTNRDGILPFGESILYSNSDEMPSSGESILASNQQFPEPAKLPRYLRRAAILAMRPRNKWKKIG